MNRTRHFFASDSLVPGQKVVKICYKNGLEDVGLISTFHWPKATSSKKNIEVQICFVKNACYRDRSVINNVG